MHLPQQGMPEPVVAAPVEADTNAVPEELAETKEIAAPVQAAAPAEVAEIAGAAPESQGE